MLTFFIFFGLILILIIGLGVLLGSMDIKNIQAEWDKRRCEPTIMFSAFLYKPPTDPRSSSDFASDNFSFCIRSLIDDVFKQLLAPVLGIFSQQMAAANTTGGVFNSLRNQVGNMFRSFGGVFNDFFETYKRGTMQLSRITQLLKQAMLKVSAAVVSIVFLGISLMTSLLNTYDFIVKVVIIIMAILVAMIVLLFFALIPFMPIIFTTIAILTAAGLGGAVGGMAGAFCIDPNALVYLEDGSTTPLNKIKIGTKLGAGCGTVEGILETDSTGPLYRVEGIIMSGSHMVLNGDTYVFAEKYPGATLVAEEDRPAKLIILNTSSRSIPLLGEKTVIAKDWEEIPEDDDIGAELWEQLVWNILNPTQEYSPTEHYYNAGLFSNKCEVYEKKIGALQIDFVERGMEIQDINGTYTRVLGLYTGTATVPEEILKTTPSTWYTNGVRRRTEGGIWAKSPDVKGVPATGYQLITDSGTFIIHCKGNTLQVRDFTEVGWKEIDKTYESVREHLSNMNKKKELQQNSSKTCVSDFSSQGWFSYWRQIFS